MYICTCCVEGAADPWTVMADDCVKYDAQFYQLQPVAGFLSGVFEFIICYITLHYRSWFVSRNDIVKHFNTVCLLVSYM